jgi:hypothetical protein
MEGLGLPPAFCSSTEISVLSLFANRKLSTRVKLPPGERAGVSAFQKSLLVSPETMGGW